MVGIVRPCTDLIHNCQEMGFGEKWFRCYHHLCHCSLLECSLIDNWWDLLRLKNMDSETGRERESKNNHHLISLFFFSLNFGWGPFHCKDLWKGVGVSGGLGVVKLQLKQGGGTVVCSFFSASLHGNFVNSWEIHTLAAAQQRGRTVWKHNIVHRLTRTVRKSHSICCHPEMVSWGEIWLTRWSKSLGFVA